MALCTPGRISSLVVGRYSVSDWRTSHTRTQRDTHTLKWDDDDAETRGYPEYLYPHCQPVVGVVNI